MMRIHSHHDEGIGTKGVCILIDFLDLAIGTAYSVCSMDWIRIGVGVSDCVWYGGLFASGLLYWLISSTHCLLHYVSLILQKQDGQTVKSWKIKYQYRMHDYVSSDVVSFSIIRQTSIAVSSYSNSWDLTHWICIGLLPSHNQTQTTEHRIGTRGVTTVSSPNSVSILPRSIQQNSHGP